MKKLFLPVLFLLSALQMQAQITIDYADFPLDTNGDTLKAAFISLSLPEVGTNMVYDYSSSTINSSPNFTISSLQHTSSDFPANSLRRTFYYPGPFNNSFVENYLFRTLDNQCYCMLGYEQAGYTSNVSGGTVERLAGADVFPTPSPWFTFPMNYADAYVTTNRTLTDFVFTGSSFANIPNGEVSMARTTIDSINVDGWGIALLTNPFTNTIDSFDVLYLRRSTTRIDSFYNNTGAAIDSVTLAAANTIQGTSRSAIFHELYTKGTAKALITWEEYPPSQSASAFVSLDAFNEAFPVSDNEVKTALVSHRVFPNPVVNQQFQLELNKNNAENWQLEIYSTLGQAVHLQSITDNITGVELDAKMAKGFYFYAVKNELGEIVAKGQLAL